MADYPELSSRYKRVRALEDVDELKAISEGHPAAAHRRVRFVNYYTLSPGRAKPSPVDGAAVAASPNLNNSEACANETGDSKAESNSHFSAETTAAPHVDQEAAHAVSEEEDLYSADEPRPKSDAKVVAEKPWKDNNEQDDESSQDGDHRKSILHLDPAPIPEEEHVDPATPPAADTPPDAEARTDLDLAPIPPEPEEPVFPDLTRYTDKDARKQAEREARRAAKAYQQAVKDRNKAIREREKLLEKRRKKATKEAQQQQHHDEAAATATHATAEPAAPAETRDDTPSPPRKLRKFCALPSGVRRDPTWVDVYMADVDEVGAHCGLFAPGAHYDRLVGDVGSRVVSWVQEDMSTRAAMKM
ncbi:hypothetical protein ISF_03838 [Cordyceps fumosorosea ARSEF 2679]|uniref:Uncharacterized protein n=1 Tax=Cordyceps fumosorosea (strain ARSEF 2679) TaxID=1081104 RepID=A0A162JE87_CORFA|nr:hypothetical protein ISF_03838 [Cordyceps fumosorosea ARSEF 2679]OAA67662.1 hypothetical protein ISF_03838 [Cordyceps fumosorosea ARSEF 2679]